ncbi:MAG TPA: YeeE/YedE thiosulfate transporter family protein [Polyangiaceae bacterium]|nr:YeeE/YedE thiosulfate transporter family protein [Polyangiaceae bacterium]
MRANPWKFLSRKEWSPYVAGAGLGIVTTIAMAVCKKRLSGAGAYQHLSGYVGRVVAPDSVYWRYVVPTGMTWEVYLLLGTFCGALASSLASRQFKVRTMPDTQWADVFGPSVARRWLLVFVGTMILEYAASIAGGCTASLAVSGGAATAPGAFLFMAGMFGGGIPVARLLYRHRRSS